MPLIPHISLTGSHSYLNNALHKKNKNTFCDLGEVARLALVLRPVLSQIVQVVQHDL